MFSDLHGAAVACTAFIDIDCIAPDKSYPKGMAASTFEVHMKFII